MKARITPGKGTKLEVLRDAAGNPVAVELVPTFAKSTGQATLAELTNTNDNGVVLDTLDLVVSAKTGRVAKIGTTKTGGVKAAADAITGADAKQAPNPDALREPIKVPAQASGSVPPRSTRTGQDRQ